MFIRQRISYLTISMMVLALLASTATAQTPSVRSSIQSTTSSGSNAQVVVAEGLGKDVEAASKNAAENALRSAIGSFVQSDTLLAKKSEISDGIRSETKALQSTVREYSQGSIARFEVISSDAVDGWVRVTARVTIRSSNFEGFVRRIVEGNGIIQGGSLLTAAETNRSNIANLKKLLAGYLNSIVSGEVVDIEVSNAIRLQDSVLYWENKNQEVLERLALRNAEYQQRLHQPGFRGTVGGSVLREFKYSSGQFFQLAKEFDTERSSSHLLVFVIRTKLRPDFAKAFIDAMDALGQTEADRNGDKFVVSYLQKRSPSLGEGVAVPFVKQRSWSFDFDEIGVGISYGFDLEFLDKNGSKIISTTVAPQNKKTRHTKPWLNPEESILMLAIDNVATDLGISDGLDEFGRLALVEPRPVDWRSSTLPGRGLEIFSGREIFCLVRLSDDQLRDVERFVVKFRGAAVLQGG